ncbi:MAG: RNA polymerase sporulation sigma factor SigG [Dethiobacter sp.]|nr:RNA polymerase sporulation sigma factor SigG [Dethiobacter sp.]MCL5981862.1 RNA polymerase sporulation sigma factor SigG [Bacillota bacterium]
MHNKRVNVCGVNTYQLPVLSNVRMRELFQRVGAGDPDARQVIISGNLRLVLSVLQRFKNCGENLDDLFQVGCVGLLKAVDNFQLGHNVHFSTYAVPMIIGEIKRYLRDNNTLRVGRALKVRAHQAQQIRETLTGRLLREPTVGEVAAELGITAEEVVFACQASYEPLSLYEPLFNDTVDPVYVMDTISDVRNSADLWLEDIALQEALEGLTERERQILQYRFFAGQTQAEIARELGLSQAQVSRIEKAALQRVRSQLSVGEVTKHA